LPQSVKLSVRVVICFLSHEQLCKLLISLNYLSRKIQCYYLYSHLYGCEDCCSLFTAPDSGEMRPFAFDNIQIGSARRMRSQPLFERLGGWHIFLSYYLYHRSFNIFIGTLREFVACFT
jgi:hypothetical protein